MTVKSWSESSKKFMEIEEAAGIDLDCPEKLIIDIFTEIPTKDKREKFMRMVYNWADLSKDPRTRIGAIIVKDDVPISSGFNNFPRKVKDFVDRYNNKEIKYQFVAHAESNSIYNAARMGHKTDGAIMFTQGVACAECMKGIINSGISKLICHVQWPNLTHSLKWVESTEISLQMAKESGVEIEWLDMRLGIKGFLDGREIWV